MFTDNWCSSPLLTEYLHKKKINFCGTARKHRLEMPYPEPKLEPGETKTKAYGPVMLVYWQDKRLVHILTTLHENKVVPTGKTDPKTNAAIQKPLAVTEYNLNMGAVDKVDMILSSINCLQKTIKWYKKLFFHFEQYCVVNAYSMYKINTGSHISLANFQLRVDSSANTKIL